MERLWLPLTLLVLGSSTLTYANLVVGPRVFARPTERAGDASTDVAAPEPLTPVAAASVAAEAPNESPRIVLDVPQTSPSRVDEPPTLVLQFGRPGQHRLSHQAREQLQHYVSPALGDPSLRISIRGHADGSGNERLNHRVSWSRAQAAKRACVRAGIDPSRIEIEAVASDEPILDEAGNEIRARSRRVELSLYPPVLNETPKGTK